MNFNYSRLYNKIVEKYGSKHDFAKAAGLPEKSIILKLDGKDGWKQDEIAKNIELLEIDSSDIPRYFLIIKFKKNEQKINIQIIYAGGGIKKCLKIIFWKRIMMMLWKKSTGLSASMKRL
ncbi:DUF739 family protein [Oceanobacillus sojae]|uniref:DUF739 family protein n=1 Tax=Oceanobacillus sojae TaxID=582851 RepID=UPI00098868A5